MTKSFLNEYILIGQMDQNTIMIILHTLFQEKPFTAFNTNIYKKTARKVNIPIRKMRRRQRRKSLSDINNNEKIKSDKNNEIKNGIVKRETESGKSIKERSAEVNYAQEPR